MSRSLNYKTKKRPFYSRSTAISMHAAPPQFFTTFLVWSAMLGDDDAERLFWSVTGVDIKWLDIFVDVAPRLIDGRLHVRNRLLGQAECWKKISRCWTYAMKWRKFSATRWLSVGKACRHVVRTLVLGLYELVKLTRSCKHGSEYWIHLWDNCREEERLFMMIASLATYPIESALVLIMEDTP